MFSNAVTQFLQVIKPISSRTCFLAYNSELGYSGKKPNRGCWRHTFLKKNPGIFRFVLLPLEIQNKIKLHLWKFHQIVSHPLEFQRSKTNTHRNFTLFFAWSCLEIPLLFLLTLGVSRFYFFNPLEIPCSQHPLSPHCFFFSGKVLEVVTDSQTKIWNS